MRHLRILVVEDDATIAENLTEKLEALGHDVCAVESSESDAVVSACRFQPDLVIIDPWLGDGTGMTELERQGICAPPQLFVSTDVESVEETHPGAVVVDKSCQDLELSRAIRRAMHMD